MLKLRTGFAATAMAIALAVGTAGCIPGMNSDEPEDQPVVGTEETDSGTGVLEQTSPDETEPAEPEAEESEPEPEEPAGSNAALEAYVASEQAQIPMLIDYFAGLYTDITIESFGDQGVEYAYVYSEQLDASLAADALADQQQQLQDACDNLLFPAMEAAGIGSDPQARYVYINADGSEIWSMTFSAS